MNQTRDIHQPTCPLCTSKKARFAFVKFNYSHFQCCSCKSLYVYPSPSSVELEEYYNKNEGNQLSTVCWTDIPDSHQHVWDVWKEALKYIEKFAGHGSLLDVGCGTGQFLIFAKRLGWTDLTGIELVPEVASRARNLSGAVIYTSDLLTTSLPAESFSGIVLWDIIEHLNNVQAVLQETFRLLKPGGVIFIGTVHYHGLSMRLLDKQALTVNPPEHLIFFTNKGMRKSLEFAKFNIKKQWSFSVYLREWMYLFSRVKSNNVGKYKSDTNYSSDITKSKLFMILMKIANVTLSVTNLGDELVAIAQKPNQK